MGDALNNTEKEKKKHIQTKLMKSKHFASETEVCSRSPAFFNYCTPGIEGGRATKTITNNNTVV